MEAHREDITAHDDLRRRCPMLGHEVAFAYCRAPGQELPCRRILDCWWEGFDVEGFLRRHFSPDQIRQVLAPSPGRIASIVELIQKARRPPGRGD